MPTLDLGKVVGERGANATINGAETLNIATSDGLEGQQAGDTYTISGTNLALKERTIAAKSTYPYLNTENNSVQLADIKEDGCYIINPDWTVLDGPEGFQPSGLKVENYSYELYQVAFIKQTVESVLYRSTDRYVRYTNYRGEYGAWVKEPQENQYPISQYNNQYTINCSPTITTDTNNYIAAPGDQTDMTGAIQAMLNTARTCRLGPGVFYVTGVEIPPTGMLQGCGCKTKLVLADSVTDGYAVKLNTYGCIQDCMIGGTSQAGTRIPLTETLGTRHGIVYQGAASTKGAVPYRATIRNVTIYNFSGGGITCCDTGLSPASSLNVSDVFVFWCGAGINISFYSEYHRFSNVSADGCYYGCINNGGNNVFTNCGFNSNTVGILMDNSTGQSTNNSHGSYVGCTINHSGGNSGIAIKLLGINLGEIFDACQLFFGKILVDGCEGVRFANFNVGSKTPIEIVNSKGIRFDGWVIASATETPVTIRESTGVSFTDCMLLSGTPFVVG